MARLNTLYKPRTASRFKNLPSIPTPTSTTKFRTLKKPDRARFTKVKSGAGNNFPGVISKNKSVTYKDGTPGTFTQSVQGYEGKHFIKKALEETVKLYKVELD